MTPERRGQHPILRFLLWWVAPLDEGKKGLSLVRLESAACFGIVAHDVWHEKPLTWVHFWILVAGFSAAFGKKVWVWFLTRIQEKAESKDVTARIDLRTLPNAKTDDERG